MLGRWHAAAGNGGFLVADCEDAGALARWLHGWTDLIGPKQAEPRKGMGE